MDVCCTRTELCWSICVLRCGLVAAVVLFQVTFWQHPVVVVLFYMVEWWLFFLFGSYKELYVCRVYFTLRLYTY